MRRLGLIVLAIAILLGATATFGILNLQNARTAANNATRVVVADRAIALGQTLTPDMLRLQAWPAGAVPPGAFTQVAELTSESRVALRAIEPNEPVLASRVSGAGGRATLSATIAEGHRADADNIVDVLPGDFVDVLLTREEGQSHNNTNMRTDLLIQNVRVLAIDQTASENRNDPQVVRAVTIEVTPEDGQKVALASQVGTMTLALRRADEIGQTNRTPITTIRMQDLRAEAERATLTATPRPVRSRAAHAPVGPSIEIIRGFTSNRAPVASE